MDNYDLKIKEYRELKKLTQTQLALEINISQNFLSEIENGRHNMSVKLLLKISDILEVCPNRLIGYECKHNCCSKHCNDEFF